MRTAGRVSSMLLHSDNAQRPVLSLKCDMQACCWAVLCLEVQLTNLTCALLQCRAKGSSRLEPVLTPRFVPSCTLPLLEGLGKLAAETSAPVQSHISESLDEVAFAKALHPEVSLCCI